MKKLLFALSVVALTGVAYACCGGPSCPPLTVSVDVSPKVLWPPNHKMVNIDVDIQTNGFAQVIKVTSNEPDNGLGDGDTAGDIKLTRKGLALRAERSGKGDGRVYTILVRATDICGAVGYASTTVTVPHDKGKKKQPLHALS